MVVTAASMPVELVMAIEEAFLGLRLCAPPADNI
jgi:hypothetical protein